MDKNNGGCAFPGFNYVSSNVHDGMTLRDYFAAQAMQALLNGRLIQRTVVVGVNCVERQIAEDAYKMADAMLKAREE